MILGKLFHEGLISAGFKSIHIPKRILRKIESSEALQILQWVCVYLLLNKYVLCKAKKSGKLLTFFQNLEIITEGESERLAELCVEKFSKCSNVMNIYELLREVPKYPMFIIDLSFWHEHTEGEKKELVEQILMSLKIVRSFLWDECLVITSSNSEFEYLLSKFARNLIHKMIITKDNVSTYLKKLMIKEKIVPVVLDPEAIQDLTIQDLNLYNIYILGGIVDKERVDKYGTYRLYNTLKLYELNIPRSKISLKGSVIGVPDRINRIIEIILLAKYVLNNLEKAILTVQSRRDKYLRVIYEIQKYARKVKSNDKVIHIVNKAFLNYLVKTYNIDDKMLSRISKSLNLEVLDNELENIFNN